MKKLINLLGAKALNKNEQKSINGGAPGPKITCQELFISADCCDPRWSSCGFGGAQYCINGYCIL